MWSELNWFIRLYIFVGYSNWYKWYCGKWYCFHPVCLCICLCVWLSVCLCVRPISWYFISRLLEEISIWNVYRILMGVVLNWLKKNLTFIGQWSRSKVYCFLKVQSYHKNWAIENFNIFCRHLFVCPIKWNNKKLRERRNDVKKNTSIFDRHQILHTDREYE